MYLKSYLDQALIFFGSSFSTIARRRAGIRVDCLHYSHLGKLGDLNQTHCQTNYVNPTN